MKCSIFLTSYKRPSPRGFPLAERQIRWQSTSATAHTRIQSSIGTKSRSPSIASPNSHLTRLATGSLLRNLFLSYFLTSPKLYKPGFALFAKIAESKNSILNPDKNPILRSIIRPIVYNQFCAGRNAAEIQRTSDDIKRLGFSGVVLCYGKEVQVNNDSTFIGYGDHERVSMKEEVSKWKEGNLQTLRMIQPGDWLGLKYTGAGTSITQYLLDGKEAPAEFVEAMDSLCRQAIAQKCRIWIDAEQQALQPTIDQWTFALMKVYNKRDQPVLYSTVQAYLKASRDKIQHQLQLSQREGWTLGIKLVRGAYIANDIRRKIHDTKAETDKSYNGIVRDLLSGNFPAFKTKSPPRFQLLLAGHNPDTIRSAAGLTEKLASESKLKVVPEFAQLQGMADDIGCELIQRGDTMKSKVDLNIRVYKCLTWGSIQECMQYLLRRLVENHGAAERIADGSVQFRQELKRRFLPGFLRRQSS